MADATAPLPESTRLPHYRADIDGLRAIAVLIVLLFHAKLDVGGGFVGVDVFFVISGYLITSIIYRELAEGHFSLRKFYERRARRILPALLITLLVVLVTGVVLLLPNDLVGLSKSTLATLAFVSNIYFWRTTGYFDGPADYKPLLHTWSLGVEEQYYIFFPLILAVAGRFGRGVLKTSVVAMILTSFVLSVAMLSLNKIAPAFYLIPSRAWELMVGSLLALNLVPVVRGVAARTVLAVGGLLMIAWAAVTYKASMLFPGVAAVLPCLGAAAIIAAGRDGEHLVTGLLSWRPLVKIGLASYSLYLVHWPVLVFARYVLVRDLNRLESLLAVGVSLGLAFLFLRFVEKPARIGRSLKALLLTTLALTIACAGIAGIAIVGNGFPTRFKPAVVAANANGGDVFKCRLTDLMTFGTYYGCALNLPSHDASVVRVVILGDSHAQMYAPALLAALKSSGESGMLVGTTGCPPLARRSVGIECARINAATIDKLGRTQAVRTVILGLYWNELGNASLVGPDVGALRGSAFSAVISEMSESVRRLRVQGKHVVIVGPIAAPGYDISNVYARHLAFGGGTKSPLSVERATFEASVEPVLDWLAREEKVKGVTVIYPHRRQCDVKRCYYMAKGRALFADGNHFAQSYAVGLADLFDQVVRSR